MTVPILVPMQREMFGAFAAGANNSYAHNQVLAGCMALDEAQAKAVAMVAQLLPQGIDTPNHFFYEIRDPSKITVGYVWFAVVGNGAARVGHVYNIRINPDHQRKGYGKTALLALESIAAEMQLPAIRLNVFGHNKAAQALYLSLGYEVTASSMRKPLHHDA